MLARKSEHRFSSLCVASVEWGVGVVRTIFLICRAMLAHCVLLAYYLHLLYDQMINFENMASAIDVCMRFECKKMSICAHHLFYLSGNA